LLDCKYTRKSASERTNVSIRVLMLSVSTMTPVWLSDKRVALTIQRWLHTTVVLSIGTLTFTLKKKKKKIYRQRLEHINFVDSGLYLIYYLSYWLHFIYLMLRAYSTSALIRCNLSFQQVVLTQFKIKNIKGMLYTDSSLLVDFLGRKLLISSRIFPQLHEWRL
jgi:hypothetical protein